MQSQRPSFQLGRLLAETLEPRVLYSASPIGILPSSDMAPETEWGDEVVQVGLAWSGSTEADDEMVATREHELSHLLEQASDGEEWTLLSDWIALLADPGAE